MTLHVNVADICPLDNGCDFVTDLLGHESRCLECPLSECIEDSPHHREGATNVWLRHESMREAYYVKGWTVARIAVEFDVSQRTVQRVVAQGEEVACPTS